MSAFNGPTIYTIDINLVAKRVLVVCLVIEGTLVLADIIFNYLDVFNELNIRRIWNIARELSIPTWFASTQTQLMGLTAIIIGLLQKNATSRLPYFSWLVAGSFFIWIGIDDAMEIHEKLGSAIDNLIYGDTEGNSLSYSWHSYIAPFYVVFGIYLTYHFWRVMHPHSLFRYVFTGFSCWIVSQGIDFIEGMDDAELIYSCIEEALLIEETYLIPHTLKVVEETIEMVGTTFLWVGFLYYLGVVINNSALRFEKA